MIMAKTPKKPKPDKKVTRYTYDEIKEPRMPETGHTQLLPAEEQVVTLPMDNGWSKAVVVGKLPEGDERLRMDARWKYGAPAAGNANFAWVQHIVHHLAPSGVAGFVLANGAMSSNQSGEGKVFLDSREGLA